MHGGAGAAAGMDMDGNVEACSGGGGAAAGGSGAPRPVNLGPLERIPVGEGRSFRVGDEEIAVFRTRTAEVFAVQAECPHKGGPLADGLLGDGRIYCPLHAYAFDLATGEPVRNACSPLRTYAISVTVAGELVVRAIGAAPVPVAVSVNE